MSFHKTTIPRILRSSRAASRTEAMKGLEMAVFVMSFVQLRIAKVKSLSLSVLYSTYWLLEEPTLGMASRAACIRWAIKI